MDPLGAGTYAPALAAAVDAFFSWYYRTFPVNATFIGVHEHDSRLPDYSQHGAGDALAGVETLQARFRTLPPEPLAEAETLDRHLIEGMLEIYRWELTSHHFHRANPSLYTGEAVFGVIGLFLRPFAPIQTRVDAAVERMRATPALLGQGREAIGRAPRAWLERAIRDCGGACAFFDHGVKILIRDEGIRHPDFGSAATTAAAAFREFQMHLEAALPRAAEHYACGSEALELLIRRGHCLDWDAATIRGLAEERMLAAEADLRIRAAETDATSWREALGRLAQRHPPVGQYYARYAEVWRAARRAAEEHRLLTWPEYPIVFVPQPAWARETAPTLYFLFYRAPAAFDRVPVVDYLVTPIDPDMPPAEQARRLAATNDSVIKINHVVHHGGIGHHVQNWHAYRAASRTGQVAAVDCATRIGMFCGGTMAEGWACYATDLMEDIGFLEPLERVAQAHARLRMAARAMADVKLHTGEWTLDQTAACYRDRAGMPPVAARGEAVKNSMFPGTALMYLMGTEVIHGLRRDLAARQPDFTLRRFHDTFLSYGSVPVALIAVAMRARAAAPARD